MLKPFYHKHLHPNLISIQLVNQSQKKKIIMSPSLHQYFCHVLRHVIIYYIMFTLTQKGKR